MIVLNTRRLATAAAFVVGVAAGHPAFAQNALFQLFELEGDATTETTAPGPDDWGNVLNQSGPPFTSNVPSTTAKLGRVTQTEPCPAPQIGVSCIPEQVTGWPGLIGDPATGPIDQIFTGGGSKDTQDILTGPWLWKFASPSPDKDNILHAAAAAYVLGSNFPACPLGTENTNCNGDLVIVFMLDRLANNGEADTGFWFLQNGIQTQGGVKKGGGFTFNTAGHVTNDILVQIDYPQASGAIPNARVVAWDPTVAGNLRVIAGGATGSPALCDSTKDQLFCAIANNVPFPAGANISSMGTSPSPWPFAPKSPAADCNTTTFPGQNVSNGCFPAQSFFEGAINLSRAFRLLNVTSIPCITGFVAETRSSAAFDSSLQDFALGSFQLCGMSVTKNCSFQSVSTNDSSVTWSFTGTLTNTGIGTVFDIAMTDTIGNAGPVPASVTFNPVLGTNNSLGAGQSTTYSGTYMTGPISSTTDTIHVTANATHGGQAIPPADSNQATCMFMPTSGISVTKLCGGTTLQLIQTTINGNTQTAVTANVSVNGMVCNTTCANPSFGSQCSNSTSHNPPGNGGVGTLLNNVTVHDDTDGNGTLTLTPSVTTLYPLDQNSSSTPSCASYTFSYVPTTDAVGGVLNTNPCTAKFHDQVTATGTPTFNQSAVNDVATQDCPLCSCTP